MFIIRPAKITKVRNNVGPGQWMAGFKYAPLPCTVKYNSAFKKQEVWSLATLWMNLEDNLINGINQVQRRGPPNVLGENRTKQRRKGFPEAGGGVAAFQQDRRVAFTALFVATIRNDVFFRIAKEWV